MIRRTFLPAALLSTLTFGSAFVPPASAQTKPPVYVVIDITEMKDLDGYMKAVTAAEPKATQAAGGRWLVRTTKAITLDGDPAPNRFVVIAFDNEEQAMAWKNSQPIKDLNAARSRTTKSRSFLVEGVAN